MEFKEKEPALRNEINILREEITNEKNSLKKYEIDLKRKIEEDKQRILEKSKEIQSMKQEGIVKEKDTKEGKKMFVERRKNEHVKVDKARRQIKDLGNEFRMVHSEKLVAEDCLAEYQSLNYKQAKKIKSLKTEVQYIKFRLSEELYKFASELEELKDKRSELEEEFESKIESILNANI